MESVLIVLGALNLVTAATALVWYCSRRRRSQSRGLCCVEGCRGTAAVFIWTERGPAAFCSDCAELLAEQARRRVPGH